MHGRRLLLVVVRDVCVVQHEIDLSWSVVDCGLFTAYDVGFVSRCGHHELFQWCLLVVNYESLTYIGVANSVHECFFDFLLDFWFRFTEVNLGGEHL